MKMNTKRIVLIIIAIIAAAGIVFVYNDAFLYDTTIAKVTDVTNEFSHEEEGPNGEGESYYDQMLEVRILNGRHKGDRINLRNTYTSSGVNDERYYKGSRMFVTLNAAGDGGSILGKKRDVYVALFFAAFVLMLVTVSGKHGGIVLVSFIINLILLMSALKVYDTYGNLLKVTMTVMLFFGVLTLIFAGGFHKKTWVAVLSTFVTVFLCFGIYMVTMKTSERIPYEMMDYIVNPKDLSDLFLAGTLMGSLGAVMDVCISISAGISEVVVKTPNISLKAILSSIREMGYDIMGTMINVLFFTYLSGTIPILVLKIKNGYTLYHLIRFQLVFETICFLIGAIGIVLAIPVSGLLSAVFFGKTGKDRRVDISNTGRDEEVTK
ncbi:MAG: YibE/F family protein [Lachnospiraceae bacterium]|nr:YibE/F family protein [Lachnospiraceae bacterium]